MDGNFLSSGMSPCHSKTARQGYSKDNTMTSNVDHPEHYNQHPTGVECIDIIEHFNFNVGVTIKHLWRAGLKGDALEDLQKAAWYLQREIKRVQRFPQQEEICSLK